MAKLTRGDLSHIKLYERNFVIATRASEVIGPDIEEDRITCRNGCKREGVSKVVISANSVSNDQHSHSTASTFAVRQVRSEFGKGCNQWIVLSDISIAGAVGETLEILDLYAFAFPASKTPPIYSYIIPICKPRCFRAFWCTGQ